MSVLLLGLTGTGVHAEPASSVSSAADQAARQVGEAFKPLWGTVLSSLPNNRYLLDVTAESGAYVGMELEIFREGEPFKHPVTGQVLGRMDRPVGVVRLVEVQDQFSVAEMVQLEDGEKCRQGDGVRVSEARILAGLAHVTSSVIDERQARILHREIEAALLKTGRFEVMDERMMRATLTKEQVADTTALTDPRVLEILRETLRLYAVIFPVVRSTEDGLNVELKVVSTFSGRPLYLASAEVRMAAAASTAPEQQQVKPQTPAPAPQPAMVPAAEDTPQPAWIGPPGQRSGDTFLAVPYMGIPSARLDLGPEFDGELRGIAVADFTGDGRKEVAVALSKRISIYAVQGKAFRLLWSSKDQSWEGDHDILALDAADINGNGVAEIFVSSYYGGEPNSFVLELQKGEWVRTWTDVDLFFRVLHDGADRPVLYAQWVGHETLFPKGVRTYVAKNGHYERKAEPKLPRGTYIYNFAVGDVQNTGRKKQVVQINDSRRLRLWSGGKLKSEPSELFGGGGIMFEFVPPRIRDNVITNPAEYEHTTPRRYVHPRLLITDVTGDGKQELVAVRNMQTGTTIFEHLAFYNKSKIVALQWGPTGFQIVWETPELEGYITDLYFGELGDGQGRVLMFALVRPGQLGLSSGTSGLFMYRLPPGEPQPQKASVPQVGRVAN
jgi:hypothetical protein